MTNIYRDQREPLPIVGLRSKEMAACLSVSLRTLQDLVRAGLIPCFTWGRVKIFNPEMVRDAVAKLSQADSLNRSTPSDPIAKPGMPPRRRITPPEAGSN